MQGRSDYFAPPSPTSPLRTADEALMAELRGRSRRERTWEKSSSSSSSSRQGDEGKSSPSSEGLQAVRRFADDFARLAPAFRAGVRPFLLQLLRLTINAALLLLWPLFRFVWSFVHRHKAAKADKNIEQRIIYGMHAAEKYSDWLKYAACLDRMSGFTGWADADEGPYDYKVLAERVERMEDLVHMRDAKGCVAEIMSGLHRHMAGITNPELCIYLTGTKNLIVEYQQAVKRMCEIVLESDDLSTAEKYACFDHASKSFGRSALLLSGGGALGLYHTGVFKAFFEAGLLPKVISGSSAGAIIASIFATKTDEELEKVAEEELSDVTNLCFSSFSMNAFDVEVFGGREGFGDAVFRVLAGEASFMSSDALRNMLRENIGDLTFEESYRKTGRILNVAVAVEEPSSSSGVGGCQLNYITSPHVVIWSAVVASCSVPTLFSKVALFAKDTNGELVEFDPAHGERYFDGSIAADLPMKRLRELFNIDFFIVSQTNPHVVPFVQKEQLAAGHVARKCTPSSFWRSLWGFLLWAVRAVLAEVAHAVLALGRVFTFLSRNQFYHIMDQSYTGDITIWPGVRWIDYFSIVLNPTDKYISHTITKGQRAVWPHVTRLTCCTYIERTLSVMKAEARKRLLEETQTQG